MSGLEGITFNHYHIQRLLKRGGMSEVYLAQDEQRKCEVAIKMVHSSQIDDIKRFQREVNLVSALAHDHILPIFDSGLYDQWQYMVMPYIESGTLHERLAQQPLTQAEAGVMLEQITNALQYAHDHGIIHRDIKPTNVLQRDEQYVYLTDFGVAKAIEEETSLTQTGFLIGTPKYMAPELVSEPASTLSDIYSLGILLYQMLTGQTPFEGSTPFEILQKHVQAQPTPPSVLNPAISPPVEHVILQALEKDPHRRFQNPQDMAQAYKNALMTMALATTQPHVVIQPQRIRRYRFSTRLAMTALLTLVFLLGTTVLLGSFMNRGGVAPVRGTSKPLVSPTEQLQKKSPVTTPQSSSTAKSTPTPTPTIEQQDQGNGKGYSHGHKHGHK